MKLKPLLYSIAKNECVALVILLILNWSISILLCKYFLKTSKLYHLELSYEKYMLKAKKLEESSTTAKLELESRLKSNSPKRGVLFSRPSSANFLCVGVISKNRIQSNVNYVKQSLMSILTRTSLDFENEILLTAFNMESPPDLNKNLLEFSSIIKIVNISSNIASTARVKEAADYSLILNYLTKFSCKYSILMEDDAIISHDWYDRIKIGLESMPSNQLNNFLCIKLFAGYKFFDWYWLNYPTSILRVLFYSILLHLFNYYMLKYFVSHKFKLITQAVVFINSTVILVIYTSTSTNPCGYEIHEYNTGFGLVSILFPNDKLNHFSSYLNKTVYDFTELRSKFFLPKDLLLDSYKNDSKLIEYIIEPSLVQHIGMHSSLYDRATDRVGYKNLYKSFSCVDCNELFELDKNKFA